jgi:hypothetical protein
MSATSAVAVMRPNPRDGEQQRDVGHLAGEDRELPFDRVDVRLERVDLVSRFGERRAHHRGHR